MTLFGPGVSAFNKAAPTNPRIAFDETTISPRATTGCRTRNFRRDAAGLRKGARTER